LPKQTVPTITSEVTVEPNVPVRKSAIKNSKTQKKVKFDNYVQYLDLIRQKDSEGLKDLLSTFYSNNKKGMNLNYQNHMGISPLHICAETGNLEILKYIVEEAPRPFEDKTDFTNDQVVSGELCINIRDIEGWTPLHSASAEGNLEVLKYLISHGGDIDAINGDEESVLDVAEEEDVKAFIEAYE
jgi:ankyrin repeat protein